MSSIRDRFPHYAWTVAVSPLQLQWVKGVCVLRCSLLPALWAEWPGSFTCHCGNTRVEHKSNKSAHKVNSGEENSPAIPAGIQTHNLLIVSRVLSSSHGESWTKYNLTEPIPLQVEDVANEFIMEPFNLSVQWCRVDTSYFTHNQETRGGRERLPSWIGLKDLPTALVLYQQANLAPMNSCKVNILMQFMWHLGV